METGCAIADSMMINRSIDHLDLQGGNVFHDVGIIKMAEVLKVNDVLTFLNLQYTFFGDPGAKALGKALKINKTLKTLLVFNIDKVTASGWSSFADGLAANTSLVTIDLSSNKMTDESGKYLATSLKDNNSIQNLYLGYNLFTDETAKVFLELIKLYKKFFLNFDIKNCQVSQEMIDEINNAITENSCSGDK